VTRWNETARNVAMNLMETTMSTPPGRVPEAPSLMTMITGAWASQAICVAARLGLADLLHDEARHVADLAVATKTDPSALARLLRALSALGVFSEIEPGVFACAAPGEQLRTDVAGSLRNLAMFVGSEDARMAWSDLIYSVRTGNSAFRKIFGTSTFEHRASRPEEAWIFNEAMAEMTRQAGNATVAAYDFNRFKTIVDVGGGNGALLSVVLSRCPGLNGTIFDIPSGTSDASEALTTAGLSNRCRIVHGDFFKTVPPGADAYILKSVIHDWDDASSRNILTNCAAAMAVDSRLLLIEQVLPARVNAIPAHRRAFLTDLNMLVMTTGCERTDAHYRDLLASSGLSVETIVPTASPFSVIEARRII
jgi:O-methyltransferase domain/Dimerisation domain